MYGHTRRRYSFSSEPSTSQTSPNLPATIIAADYAAGVLTLTIPVREAAKPRSIQVTSSDHLQAVSA